MVLGLFSLGSLTVFFNDMLVSGFSTGAAFHVVTSQIKDLLGISVQTFSGPFKIIYVGCGEGGVWDLGNKGWSVRFERGDWGDW